MTSELTWVAALSTVSILVVYEAALAMAQRRAPGRLARTAHASLRQEWFEAISAQKGSEILAVQTLRNSLMSATMTASTAALGLMATSTLAVPSLHSTFDEATGVPNFTPRLVELVREHLRDIQVEFSKGDFSGPSHIHGNEMPGLAAVKAAKPREITIVYKEVDGGAELTYRARDAKLVAALHEWFDAQLSDHGGDAMDGHQYHGHGVAPKP